MYDSKGSSVAGCSTSSDYDDDGAQAEDDDEEDEENDEDYEEDYDDYSDCVRGAPFPRRPATLATLGYCMANN